MREEESTQGNKCRAPRETPPGTIMAFGKKASGRADVAWCDPASSIKLQGERGKSKQFVRSEGENESKLTQARLLGGAKRARLQRSNLDSSLPTKGAKATGEMGIELRAATERPRIKGVPESSCCSHQNHQVNSENDKLLSGKESGFHEGTPKV